MAFVKLDNKLHNLLVKILGESNRDYIRLSLCWADIVGSYLAENSYIYNIEKGVLFVGVVNGVVMQELCLLREGLKEKIASQHKIKLTDIVFFIRDDVRKKN